MNLLRKLWAILSLAERRRFGVVLGLALIAAAAEAGVVALIDPVIDGLTGADGESSIGALVVLGAMMMVKNVLVILLLWVKNRELFAVQANVSEQLLDAYIQADDPRLRDLDAGQRTSFAITEPLQLVLNGYLPVVTITVEALTVAAVLAVLVWQQPIETVVLLTLLGIGLFVFSRLTRKRIMAYGMKRRDGDTARSELVRAVLESRVEVRGLGARGEVLDRYAVPNRLSAAMTARKGFLTEVSKNVLEMLVAVSLAPIALVLLYSDTDELLTTLAMFGVAGYRAMPAVNRIMVSSQSLRFGAATVDTLHNLLAGEAHRTGEGRAEAGPAADGREPCELGLRFHAFHLHNGKRVLDGTEVRIARGQICAVWGASGSGKSTVLEAIIDGTDGLEIRVDGIRLAGGLSSLPGHVGVTAQSPLILPGTLRENLELGTNHDGIDLVGASSLLDTDPASVLDASTIGDRLGLPIHRHMLSGGQAQRISLIRALDDARSIVLLDEPTSALDRRAADALCRRLQELKADRIVLVVTHDPAVLEIADVVLEVG